MKIKTFPIQFIDVELEEIREVAKKEKMSVKEFIYIAIKEKMERGGSK